MKKLFSLIVLSLLVSIQAADTATKIKARIDLNGRNIVALKAVSGPEGGYLRNITWGKEDKRKFYMVGESDFLPADKWSKLTFVFVPENDGVVIISLMSNFSRSKGKKKLNSHWIYYDMLTVEGATLNNGDFEDSKDGKLCGWSCPAASYITSGTAPFSGKAMIKACYNQRCTQIITVKKGQQVTIILHAKPEDVEEAE